MKRLLSSLAVVVVLLAPRSYADPIALEKEFGEEMRQIRNLFTPLLEYDSEFSRFPPHLIELVTNGKLKAESLLIRQRDGSVVVPAYFPGHSSADNPESILVAYNLPNQDKRIVLNLKGTVTIEQKPKDEQASAEPPDQPAPRTTVYPWMTLEEWRNFHKGDLARAKQGRIDVLFLGDSITEDWEKDGAKVWEENFAPLNAANFGIGGDTTQNVLWRITQGGALEGVDPRVVVLMIGSNNLGLHGDQPEAVIRGIDAIVKVFTKERPETRLLLLDIFPRDNPGGPLRTKVSEANRLLEDYAKAHPRITRLRI